MAEHNEFGKIGEDIAKNYLIEQQYKILEQNWRYGNDEVDIIAINNDELVFVEVKTRRTDFYGSPASFVNKSKQKFIIRAANAYIDKLDLDLEVRFDVIGIILQKGKPEIEHIDGAFQPRW